jgi:hypothetical protein
MNSIGPYCAFVEPSIPQPAVLPFAATWLFILAVFGVFLWWATDAIRRDTEQKKHVACVKTSLEDTLGCMKNTIEGLEQKITEMDTKFEDTVARNLAQITELKSIVSILAAEQVLQLNARTGQSMKAKMFNLNLQYYRGADYTHNQRLVTRLIELDLEVEDAATLVQRMGTEYTVYCGGAAHDMEHYTIDTEPNGVGQRPRSATTMEKRRARGEPILKRERQNLAILEATESSLTALNDFLAKP